MTPHAASTTTPLALPGAPFATVLFDLDGTLIDSIELILRSYEHTFRVHYGRDLGREEWLAGLGTPLKAQFARYTCDGAEIDRLIATYRAFNLEHHDALMRRYEGAVEAVARLRARGARLGIVTSKMNQAARRGLRHCGFGDWFDVVIGADDVERHKPDPLPVRAALERLGATADSAVYVGDSPHDVAAGRAAGCRTAGVLWGPFPREWLVRAGPDLLLEAPCDLGAL